MTIEHVYTKKETFLDKAEEISLTMRHSDHEQLTNLANRLKIPMNELVNRAVATYDYLWNAHKEDWPIFIKKSGEYQEFDLEDLSSNGTNDNRGLPDHSSPNDNLTQVLVLKSLKRDVLDRKVRRLANTENRSIETMEKVFLANAIRTYFFLYTQCQTTYDQPVTLYIGDSPETAFRCQVP